MSGHDLGTDLFPTDWQTLADLMNLNSNMRFVSYDSIIMNSKNVEMNVHEGLLKFTKLPNLFSKAFLKLIVQQFFTKFRFVFKLHIQ